MFFEFINENSGFFSLLFSAVVAFATVIYAILTWKLVSETKKIRKVQTEPKIAVIIQPSERHVNIIDMEIQNIGLGPAFYLKFSIDPDFEYMKGKFLSEIGFIKNGLNYLSPNQKLKFFLTTLTEDFERKVKNTFKINISYKNSIGDKFKDSYIIDFSSLVGLTRLADPLVDISNNLRDIRNSIEKLNSALKK